MKRREDGLVALGDIAAEKGDPQIADNFRSKLDDLSKYVLNGFATLLDGMKTQPPTSSPSATSLRTRSASSGKGWSVSKIGETHDEQC